MTVRSKAGLGIVVGVVVILAGALLMGRVHYTGKMPVAAGQDAGKMPVAPATVAPAARQEPVAVTVVPLTVRPIQRNVPIVGSFFGYDEVTVTAKVAGTVVKILHDVGDAVAPGEPLVELDRTDYELAVSEGRRALELDLAKLGLEIPPQGIDVDQIEQAIRSGKIQIDQLPTVLRAKQQQENALVRLNRSKQYARAKCCVPGRIRHADDRVPGGRQRLGPDADRGAGGQGGRPLPAGLVEDRRAAPARRAGRGPPAHPARRHAGEGRVRGLAGRKVTEGEMVKDSPGSRRPGLQAGDG